jgi:hypothetical protein
MQREGFILCSSHFALYIVQTLLFLCSVMVKKSRDDGIQVLDILCRQGLLPKEAWDLDRTTHNNEAVKPAAQVCIHGEMVPATALAIMYCKTVTTLFVAGKVGGMLKILTSVDDIHICRDETAWRSNGWHKMLHKYPGHFTGDIESFASTVKRCKYSVTRDSELTELSTLTALQTLDLSYCRGLTSLPELSVLTGLQILDLSYCRGLTSLPELSTLTALQTLYLVCCYGLTTLPELSTLTALQTLDLSECSGLTALPELGTLTELQTLNLSDCVNLTTMPCLDRLIELGTRILGVVVTAIQPLTQQQQFIVQQQQSQTQMMQQQFRTQLMQQMIEHQNQQQQQKQQQQQQQRIEQEQRFQSQMQQQQQQQQQQIEHEKAIPVADAAAATVSPAAPVAMMLQCVTQRMQPMVLIVERTGDFAVQNQQREQ